MKTMKFLLVLLIFSLMQTTLTQTVKSTGHEEKITDATILFQENFEDTDFASRGWYDALRGTITNAEHIAGSTSSLECKFLQGERGPEGGTPGRHLFKETDEVYLSYHVKYSSNYTGSNRPYHPHEFHFLTTENSKYVGPAYTHLTTYIEQIEGEPVLAIQDGENIDESNIGVDLSTSTEERAVAGCNGDSDGYGEGDCYRSGALHRNGKQWRPGRVYFQDEPGKYYKNDWHFIEVYFALNSIVNGKGVADGRVKYWYDGELLVDHDDVMLRTGEHPNMKFNQFLIAPYIGDGSPVEQIMWIDDLTVATSRINTRIGDNPSNSTLHEFVLLQNYPNPFNNQTTIRYHLSKSSHVELEIFSVTGHKVATLVSGHQSAGDYNYKWDTSDLAGGMYFYRLAAVDFFQTKKLILLK